MGKIYRQPYPTKIVGINFTSQISVLNATDFLVILVVNIAELAVVLVVNITTLSIAQITFVEN